MAQILVRNLSQRVVRNLKARAKRRGRSLQAEVKEIIEKEGNSATPDPEAADRLLIDLRKRFKGRKFPDAVALIREDRDR
jgi:plasmid stability protein